MGFVDDFFGAYSGYSNTTGNAESFFGAYSGYSNTTGVSNSFFGDHTGYFNTTGNFNTYIGSYAGYADTGSFNTYLGASTSTAAASTGSYNISIGQNIAPASLSASSQLNIGNVIYGSGMYNGTSSTSTPSSSSKIGIGTSVLNYALTVKSYDSATTTVARFITSSGSYCDIQPANASLVCSSDMNLKKNIANIESNTDWTYNSTISSNLNQSSTILEKITNLNPVLYNWKTENDTDPKHIGFIAQEVEQVFPDLVTTDSDTKLKSLNYIGFIPYITKAIKELNAKVSNSSSNYYYSSSISLDSILNPVKDLLSNVDNQIGDVYARVFHSEEGITKKMCVDDVCVNRDQFLQMIQHYGSVPVSPTNYSISTN